MTQQSTVVLIIDDDRNMRWAMRNIMSDAGFEVAEAEAGEPGIATAARCRPHAVLLDIRMPGLAGDEVLKRLRRLDPNLPVIIVTAHASIPSAVSMTQDGAFDFVTKPFRNEQLLETVQRAVRRRPLARDAAGLRAAITAIMGQGPSIQKLVDDIAAIVSTDYSVVINGETGAGKEVVARALHQNGPRSAQPLVTVDCGALEETLIDSEFFGHEKGAYTGASGRQQGCFEAAANGGTLFLDEIGNLPMKGQKALLRTLDQRTIRRVGGRELIKLDTRVLAATNEDLRTQATTGGFREDLLYRLAEYVIEVPSLRSRPEDVPFLARRFLIQAREALGRPQIELAPATIDMLCDHRWPGNVRELRNVMRRAALTDAAMITPYQIAGTLGDCAAPVSIQTDSTPAPLREHIRAQVRALECDAVVAALGQANGNKAEAARLLGIDYKTYRTKLKIVSGQQEAKASGRG